MKRHALLRHLRKNGWTNPLNGVTEAVPRHSEIPDKLVRKICKRLDVQDIKE